MLDYLGKLLKEANQVPQLGTSPPAAAGAPSIPVPAPPSGPAGLPAAPSTAPVPLAVAAPAQPVLAPVEQKDQPKPGPVPPPASAEQTAPSKPSPIAIPQETKEEREKRLAIESRVDELLKTKLDTDINLADDIADSKLLGPSAKEDELAFKGGKEFDIVLETVDFLKGAMLKTGTKCYQQTDSLNISIADKSQLIVWVYKELRDQQQQNDQLRTELSEWKQKNEEKTIRIDTVEQQLARVQQLLADLRQENQSLLSRLNVTEDEATRQKRFLIASRRRCAEIENMQTAELFRLSTVLRHMICRKTRS